MQRPEAAPQAAPEVGEAPSDVSQVARVREAAAEADRAQAEAAAVPEARLLAVRLERRAAQKRRRRLDGQQALEDRGAFLVLVTVELPGENVVRDLERRLDAREVAGQVRPVGLRESLDELREVAALLGGQLALGDLLAERAPDAEPVAEEVPAEASEGPRPAAHEPPEDDAAAQVRHAPPPRLDRPQRLAALGRDEAMNVVLGEERLEERVRAGELLLAAPGLARLLLEPLRVSRQLEVLLQERGVPLEQLSEDRLEVLVLELVVDVVLFEALGLRFPRARLEALGLLFAHACLPGHGAAAGPS